MRDGIIIGEGFKKLTVAFSVWASLLLFAAAVPRATEFSRLIAGPEQGVISGLTIAILTVLVIVARRHYRPYRPINNAIFAAVSAALVQIVVGTVAIWVDNPMAVAAHLLAAMLTLGIALFLATASHISPKRLINAGSGVSRGHGFYLRSIVSTGIGLLLLIVTGAIVTGADTRLACPDWPLCQGEIFPAEFTLTVAINLLHRFTVVVLGALVAGVILQTRRGYRQNSTLTRLSTALGLLFLAQIGLGGMYTVVDSPGLIRVFHLGLSGAIWGIVVAQASVSYLMLEPLTSPAATAGEPLSGRQKAKTFFKLTKPWIMALLLITTITAMFIAAQGAPPIALMLYTLLGGALSAGGASVLNSYIDSDIDGVMSRTSRRATVTGLVTPTETLIFGLALSIGSFLVFAIFVNMLSAVLSTLGIIYYVFFYTLYLKRATIHNIIIGGAAGAIPPLVGWTAVSNSLDLGAFYLFAIIFFWTPPHTWALALLVKKDYAQARVPMLPVVVGEKETTYQIFLYTILLITLTLLPFTFNMLSLFYLIAALGLGIPFVYLAWKLWREFDKGVSKRLYKFSQAYLALLFVAMAVDRSLF